MGIASLLLSVVAARHLRASSDADAVDALRAENRALRLAVGRVAWARRGACSVPPYAPASLVSARTRWTNDTGCATRTGIHSRISQRWEVISVILIVVSFFILVYSIVILYNIIYFFGAST